jgi:glycosyltransferase involved in cell wall biosynthesis
MKIAFISIVKDPWGGSEELWAHAAREAMQEGHEVIISAYDRGSVSPRFKELTDAGAILYLRRGYIKPGTPLYPRVARKALNFALNKVFNPFRDVFRHKPDIVVYSGSCYSIKDDPGLMDLLKKHRTPLIINTQVNLEYTRPLNDAEAASVKEAYRYAAKVTFVSQRNADVARRHLLDEIPNALIVRNPVNLADTSPVPYPPMEGPVRFAMVANLLVNHKGHDILLDLLRTAPWQERDWDLNIYGSGDDEAYIRELCRFFKLDDRVHFRGRTNDIRGVWKENHILLMPSLCEGIPLAVVEAMLCARPVVATDTGGHMEWITEGVNGFIAEGANVYSFGRALERAWDAKAAWPAMGMRAHETAIRLYDPAPGKTYLNIILAHGHRP